MAAQIHRLFFALKPDVAAAAAIARAADQLKVSKRLQGRWLRGDNHHLTVHFLGDFAQPDEIIARAASAAAQVRAAAFEIVLDHATSFPRRFNSPCILCCAADAESPLHALRQLLGDTLVAAGLGEYLESRFTPHLTIAYAKNALAESIAIERIVWRVRDFVLIDSVQGASLHREIARWALTK